MTPLEFLLNHVQEECGEIIQAASKINRFGLESVNPATGVDNRSVLVKELNDLQGVVTLLKEYLEEDNRGGLPLLGDKAEIDKKIAKVLHFAKASIALGCLQDKTTTPG